MQIRSLGREDSLEEGMATHSSILAWGICLKQRSLAGDSQAYKEWDTTEATWHTAHSNICEVISHCGFDLYLPDD